MSQRINSRMLVAPTIVVMVAFMILPMLVAFGYSLMTSGPYGGVRWPISGAGYQQMLFQRDLDDQLVFSPAYLWIIARSIVLAALTAIFSLAIGLPIAWYIVCQSPQQRLRLLFLTTLPFWINTLIRTYCWVLILRDEGLLNIGMRKLGLIETYIPFLYNDIAILLGLVYTFVPFMILPIYSTLERINPAIIEASHDLYASRWITFRRIIWPLARPGAVAGGLLVFAPALGSFLAPDLLGGGKHLLIGSLIQLQFTSSRNWPFGAALDTLVTLGILIALLFFAGKSLRAAVRQ